MAGQPATEKGTRIWKVLYKSAKNGFIMIKIDDRGNYYVLKCVAQSCNTPSQPNAENGPHFYNIENVRQRLSAKA